VNVNPISILAFKEATDEGTIASWNVRVASAYAKFAPPGSGTPRTNREICRLGDLSENINLVGARSRDLKRQGVIKVVGSRHCRESGKLAEVCEYVLPQNRVPLNDIDVKKAAILELCDMVAMLLDDPKKSLEPGVEAEYRERIGYFRDVYGGKKSKRKPRKPRAPMPS
jgi:hypothetical protein